MDTQQVADEIASKPELAVAARKVGVTPERAKSVVEGVLQHVTNGGSQAELIQGAAAHAGIDPAKVQELLPHVMPVIQQHAEQAPDGSKDQLSQVVSSVSSLFGS